MSSKYSIEGEVGDAFIKITKDSSVQLVFGEDDLSLTREVEWETHKIYKTAVQFALMIDSYLKNSEALDNLLMNSTTGSIPAELIGKDLLPIMLAGAGFEGLEEVEDKEEKPKKYKDNILHFKQRKDNDEDE